VDIGGGVEMPRSEVELTGGVAGVCLGGGLLLWGSRRRVKSHLGKEKNQKRYRGGSTVGGRNSSGVELLLPFDNLDDGESGGVGTDGLVRAQQDMF
jgi:hypothetical protein